MQKVTIYRFSKNPRYENTYDSSSWFEVNEQLDNDEFYNFVAELSKNNIVLISEYKMPENRFECIWQKERKVLQKSDRVVGDTAVEKLFIYSGEDKYLTIKEQS